MAIHGLAPNLPTPEAGARVQGRPVAAVIQFLAGLGIGLLIGTLVGVVIMASLIVSRRGTDERDV